MEPISNFKRILVAVDDSPYSEKAARYGFHLAKLMNAHVALLNVMDPPATSITSDPILGQQPFLTPDVTELQEEASSTVIAKFSDWWDGDQALSTFSKLGNPKAEILATAQEWKADLIILGTHGRTGFDHFISGSVAEGVTRRSVCPVLIVPNKDE